MPVIRLETVIKAPLERCFDLSRDIDIHVRSTEQTREVAVAGVTTGLINFGEDRHAIDALGTGYQDLIPCLHLPDPKDRSRRRGASTSAAHEESAEIDRRISSNFGKTRLAKNRFGS
jgi:hypothetical protein